MTGVLRGMRIQVHEVFGTLWVDIPGLFADRMARPVVRIEFAVVIVVKNAARVAEQVVSAAQ